MMTSDSHSPAGGASRVRFAGVAFSALLLPSLLAGCATKGDLRDVRTDIRELADNQQALLGELQRQNRMTLDTLRTQSSQLTDVRGNVSQQLRQVVQELETLTELTGQNQIALQSIRDRLAALERRGSVQGRSSMGMDGGRGDSGTMGEAAEPRVVYDEAQGHYNRGTLVAAEMGFQQFLRAYPNHDLAAVAQYRLADIMEQREEYEDALEAFRRIPELYPGHQQVPDALYRIGLLHIELGEMSDARRAFERILNSYSDSGMADLARDRLEEIGGER